MKRTRQVVLAVALGVLVVVGGYVGVTNLHPEGNESCPSGASNGPIRVVAAENFWGNLVSQLGGSRVQVTSIVCDPNIDPHSYETNTADAIAITNAQFVIVNGAGYDDWALRLISAESTPNQTILNVQEVVHVSADANPHFWYSPYYVNDTIAGMYKALVRIDPADSAYFAAQYGSLNSSLYTSFMQQETMIRHRFQGMPVAATESIFVYMANATGLNIVSPPEFMKAVSEGNDPSAQDVATFQNQLNGGIASVRVLVYNGQTVTPLTQSLLALAAQNQIPVVKITETIQPLSSTFQGWMQEEVGGLQNALGAVP